MLKVVATLLIVALVALASWYLPRVAERDARDVATHPSYGRVMLADALHGEPQR